MAFDFGVDAANRRDPYSYVDSEGNTHHTTGGGTTYTVSNGGSSGGGTPGDNAAYDQAQNIASELAQQDYGEQGLDLGAEAANQAVAAGEAVAQSNRDRFGTDFATSVSAAIAAAASIDGYMADNITNLMLEVFGEDTIAAVWGGARDAAGTVESVVNNYIDNVLPGLAGTATDLFEQASAAVSSYMSGELPDDVQDSIMRSVAERFPGLGADMYQNVTARHLGLTSLDLSNMGLQNVANVASIAESVGNLYGGATAMAATSLDAYNTLGGLRNTLMEPYRTTDVAGLSAQYLETLSGQSLDPNSAMQQYAGLLDSGMRTGAQVQVAGLDALTSLANVGLDYSYQMESLDRTEDYAREQSSINQQEAQGTVDAVRRYVEELQESAASLTNPVTVSA